VRLDLLGTGSADGWPNPWCECASCAWARAVCPRGQTAVLLDGALLLDCGPDAPRAAARFGLSLSAVRHVLFGHAHPDHTGPEALMWRDWSSAAGTGLDVVGPPAALAVCQALLARWTPGAADALRFVEAGAGAMLTLGARPDAYTVRPVAARHGDASVGPAVLYDVTGPDGTRVLYGCDTGAPLPEEARAALAGRAFDVVLLEENNGDQPGFGEHLDLDSFAAVVADLRRDGAVTATTEVLAVHLSHRNPPGDELDRRLAMIGARAPRDGERIERSPATIAGPDDTGAWSSSLTITFDAGATTSVSASSETSAGPAAAGAAGAAGPVPTGPRRVLITGGARSGKSAEAERRLAGEPAVVYVATAGPPPDGVDADPEWAARVARHQARRPSHWTTVETTDLVTLLREPGPPLLIDCLGLWLTAVMTGGGTKATAGADEVRAARDALVAAWRAAARPVVAVTNEVGSGIVPATALGRVFRDALGTLNAAIARESDEVWLVVAGMPVALRGGGRA